MVYLYIRWCQSACWHKHAPGKCGSQIQQVLGRYPQQNLPLACGTRAAGNAGPSITESSKEWTPQGFSTNNSYPQPLQSLSNCLLSGMAIVLVNNQHYHTMHEALFAPAEKGMVQLVNLAFHDKNFV